MTRTASHSSDDLPRESLAWRGLFIVLTLAVVVAQFWWLHRYWAPGHAGSNQNGYLVSGKLLATTGSPGIVASDPFLFIGEMWNMADTRPAAAQDVPGGGAHYAKYPLGLPVIYAVVYKVSGVAHRYEWTHLVSPVMTGLATIGMFFLARRVAGSFVSFLTAAIFSVLPLTAMLANNPNSHATDTALVTWGMALIAGALVGVRSDRIFRRGEMTTDVATPVGETVPGDEMARREVVTEVTTPVRVTLSPSERLLRRRERWTLIATCVGAFLLGYACTVRYSSGLLLGPVIVACLSLARFRAPRRLLVPLVPLLCWAVPVMVQVGFNLYALGALTGYDSNNESTAFRQDDLQTKYTLAVARVMYDGLFLIGPVGVLGLCTLYRKSWRLGLAMTLWAMPTMALYASYYWSDQSGAMWRFLRFFASVMPAFMMGAAFVMQQMILPRGGRADVVVGENVFVGDDVAVGETSRWTHFGSRAFAAAGLLVFALTVGWFNYRELPGPLERDATVAKNQAFSGEKVRAAVPAGSLLFLESGSLANHLQFAGDYTMYCSDWLLGGQPMQRIFPNRRPDQKVEEAASPYQPARLDMYAAQLPKYSPADRAALVKKLVADAHSQGKQAYVLSTRGAGRFDSRMLRPGGLAVEDVTAWAEPNGMSKEAMNHIGGVGSAGTMSWQPARYTLQKIIDAPVQSPAPATIPAPTTAPN